MSKTPAKAAKTKAEPAPAAPVETKPAAKAKAAPKVEAAPAPAAKAKTVEKPKDGAKPNALQQPLQPSAELAAIVGSAKLARGEVVSKVWVYIKEHKLQNPDDGREILADAKLQKVFGKPKVTMFEMNKHLAQHLK